MNDAAGPTFPAESRPQGFRRPGRTLTMSAVRGRSLSPAPPPENVMPITLGCPSCGKRFRARDESAGKRVKCPFCQAAVPVPTADEAHAAGAPTEVVADPPAGPPGGSLATLMFDESAPPLPPPRPRPRPGPASGPSAPPPVRPKAAPVPAATAADWGAADPPPGPAFSLLADDAPDPASPAAFTPGRLPPRREPAARPGRAAPAGPPQDALVGAWRKARGGLFWVQFALFWFALLGAIPFGKMVYERAVGELPKGEGWVKIDGYVNADGPDAVRVSKTEEIDLLAYGVPVLLGGLALVFGRLTAGAAPRNSGAKGLFAFSALATLIALAGVVTVVVCGKIGFGQVGGYASLAAMVGGGLGEFWFLLALGAAGATVRRPAAVRAVGFFALVVGLAVVLGTVGWDAYLKYGSELGVPKPKDADWLFYEAAVKMIGWVLVVGVYSRAVSAVRRAVREFVEDTTDGKAA